MTSASPALRALDANAGPVGCAPALAASLALTTHTCGAEERHRLWAIVREAAAGDAARTADLVAVLDALGAAGIPALVMKGAAVAITAYGGTHLRPRGDEDLLVPDAQFAGACGVLEALGYTASAQITGDLITGQRHYERTRAYGRHEVDLHRRPLNPVAFATLLSFDELHHESRPLPGLGVAARGLGPVHTALLGCAHRVAHHPSDEDPRWTLDLHLVASTFNAEDWRRFTELAVRHRVAAVCATELARATRQLKTAVPRGVLNALGQVRGEPSAAFLGARSTLHVQWLNLRHAGSWRRRVALVRQHLLPDPAYLRRRDGATSAIVLPWLYLRRACTGALRWIRASLRRR
jgi:hypothetical protein